MAITEDEFFVCDYCGEDTGQFNQQTGNHSVCEENAALRAELASCQEARDVVKRVNWKADGTLDEIVGSGFFHIEQMDDGRYYINLGGQAFVMLSKKAIQFRSQNDEELRAALAAPQSAPQTGEQG